MDALLLLFLCLALGMLVARFARPPPGLAAGLNWWVIYIALPALVLDLVPRIHWNAHLWFMAAANWLVFVGAWLLFARLGPALSWSRERVGALTLLAGLGNTAYMGYPMIEAMRGAPGLALAVVGDQTGGFTALAIGGVAVTAVYAGQALRPMQVVRRIALFPPFVAFMVAVLVGALGDWPARLHELLARLGTTLTPLALFSVGLQQRLKLPRSYLAPVCIGLGWKLLLAPAASYILGRASGVSGLVLSVGVLQAAMAPMVSAAILADQSGLEPELANTLLGVGIVLSVATVPWINTLL